MSQKPVLEVNPQKVLNQMVDEHDKLIKESEKKLVEYALKHKLNLYLGECGRDGRALIVNQRSADDWGKEVGEWLYSSETC